MRRPSPRTVFHRFRRHRPRLQCRPSSHPAPRRLHLRPRWRPCPKWTPAPCRVNSMPPSWSGHKKPLPRHLPRTAAAAPLAVAPGTIRRPLVDAPAPAWLPWWTRWPKRWHGGERRSTRRRFVWFEFFCNGKIIIIFFEKIWKMTVIFYFNGFFLFFYFLI